eukprot:16450481-Heterocapsa_arctica.AAC.1
MLLWFRCVCGAGGRSSDTSVHGYVALLRDVLWVYARENWPVDWTAVFDVRFAFLFADAS